MKQAEGQIEERKPPTQLPSNKVTVLDVYGHVFFAGARTLERLLPSPQNAEHPAVILRLRGRTMLGATLVEVLSRYAEKLKNVHGQLYLTGLSHEVHAELEHQCELRLTGPMHAFAATTVQANRPTQRTKKLKRGSWNRLRRKARTVQVRNECGHSS